MIQNSPETPSRQTPPPIIRNHRVSHIPELRLAENLFHSSFLPGCSMLNCTGTCCKFGVYVDLSERDTILANADRIRSYMDDRQERDERHWFEEKIYDDADFPSGQAAGTRAMWYGCVFLDTQGKCTLQKTSIGEGMNQHSLKPFYCVSYPVTINHGVLMLAEEDFLNNPACCRPVAAGERTLLDVCSEELLFVLGSAGLGELKDLMKIKEPREQE
jgi:hypothetical protein